MDRFEHLVPPMSIDGPKRQRKIGPGQFIPEQTAAEKLGRSAAASTAFKYDLGEHAELTALNRREVEMLLERYKQVDDVLAAEEHMGQGHFTQQELKQRRKRPGVQAIGLDMIDAEGGGHVWTEAMKMSHG